MRNQSAELQQEAYIQILENEIANLRKRLEKDAVKISINCREALQNNKEENYRNMEKYPRFIRIPVSTVRVMGLEFTRVNEISPRSMNRLVSHIEDELCERLIILVDL